MRGFIGPIGDDFPTILMIMLSFGLFFSALSFTLDTYNTKLDNLDVIKGGLEVSRVVMRQGVFPTAITGLPSAITRDAGLTAASYGVRYELGYMSSAPQPTCSGQLAIAFNFLIVRESGANNVIDTLQVCVHR